MKYIKSMYTFKGKVMKHFGLPTHIQYNIESVLGWVGSVLALDLLYRLLETKRQQSQVLTSSFFFFSICSWGKWKTN